MESKPFNRFRNPNSRSIFSIHYGKNQEIYRYRIGLLKPINSRIESNSALPCHVLYHFTLDLDFG